MRLIAAIVILAVLFLSADHAKSTVKKEMTVKDSSGYTQTIVPILQKKCMPCHFPGGKMYERMPFDNAATILQHEQGVLKRISDEVDKEKIKSFILRAK